MDIKIHNLFPTPVVQYNIPEITSEEMGEVETYSKDVLQNSGNKTSKETYVLHKGLFRIREFIETCVKDYTDNVICPGPEVAFEITQSWLNFTKTSEFHHKHSHPNSLVSGVLYFDCDENFDKIIFFKPQTHSTIVPTIKTPNYWNAGSWFFSVKTNNVVLFPSTLEHMVENKQGDNLRISLAFNVFIKGAVGEERKLTKLFL